MSSLNFENYIQFNENDSIQDMYNIFNVMSMKYKKYMEDFEKVVVKKLINVLNAIVSDIIHNRQIPTDHHFDDRFRVKILSFYNTLYTPHLKIKVSKTKANDFSLKQNIIRFDIKHNRKIIQSLLVHINLLELTAHKEIIQYLLLNKESIQV